MILVKRVAHLTQLQDALTSSIGASTAPAAMLASSRQSQIPDSGAYRHMTSYATLLDHSSTLTSLILHCVWFFNSYSSPWCLCPSFWKTQVIPSLSIIHPLSFLSIYSLLASLPVIIALFHLIPHLVLCSRVTIRIVNKNKGHYYYIDRLHLPSVATSMIVDV